MDEKYMDFYTKAEINAMLGGISFEKISKEDFDALIIKDPDKVYFVYDDQNKVTQYIGEAELGSGGQPLPSALISNPTSTSIVGNAEMEET